MRVVFFFEMIEAPLLGDKLLDRNASLARLARVPGVNDVAVDDFIQRIDAAFDSQLAKLVGVTRMIVPTLWTGIVGVDEGRAADGKRLLDLVQIIRRRKGGAGSGNVTAGRMADGQHAGDVLLPAPLHDRMLGSRRREGRLRAVSRRACCLDIGIGGRFVVVHDNQQVVIALQRGGDAADAHIAGAEIAGEIDDVDLLVFDLALALERSQARRHAHGRRATGAELRVHPRHDPRRGHVRSVGHVHATGCSCDHRARTRNLDEAAHRRRRLAALAGPMAGSIELFQRNFVNAFDLLVFDCRYGRHNGFSYLLS